ncbi:glycoside hydrolase family 97 protein [Edaphobacter sp. 12200R-103]|uniref:glycoside hydrolase family 97 protein n=1 Tax=Edaphobacter sp. 12200R-103 TaxID=2703788 RepID=UPI00138D9479|nr:glycoside hydrolase family 97 protein [Edaphobacter sp. 12200R-103]QHS51357.1 glycoside hydrolase family 97 protein [Edaphobacter sp. 12200R-103]
MCSRIAALISVFVFLIDGSLLFAQNARPSVTSPDGQLKMTFEVKPSDNTPGTMGQLTYSATFHGKPIIDSSRLGLDLEGAAVLGADVEIAEARKSSGVDVYSLRNTKISKVHDTYNSITLRVNEKGSHSRSLLVEARAYNDGLCFRYVLPTQSAIRELRLRAEATEFRFSQDATSWVLALPNYRSSYESEYVRLNLSALSNQGGVSSHFLIGTPVLLHEPGVAWLSLMEADLEGNSSMYLTNPSGNWAGHYLTVKLSPRWDDPQYAVLGSLPHHSAWRVISVADKPGQLIESNLLTDLNSPNRLRDTSWIQGGKASWNWWVDNVSKTGKNSFSTDVMKEYIDFASENGLPYFMLDAGWSKNGDITQLNGRVDVPELVRYGASKHVKVWIWLYSEAVMKQMREAFPLYEKWGVAGLKIDFINRDDQEGIQFYYDVAKYAAEHHLMIDFHGTRTPWGILRTYPNVMSYEAVLGLENNKVGRRDSPVDRTMFASTRLLAGPMDFTPGAFDNATEDNFIPRNEAPMAMGTRAQQLALYVIYENPIPMLSDSPQNYAGQPGLEFLKDVPVEWDETHVIDSNPGEFTTIVRRHGNEWYLGSMTNWTARTLDVPLRFLGAGTYIAEAYEDAMDAGKNPKHLLISKKNVTSADTLTIHLAPGGGAAIRFIRK